MSIKIFGYCIAEKLKYKLKNSATCLPVGRSIALFLFKLF